MFVTFKQKPQHKIFSVNFKCYTYNNILWKFHRKLNSVIVILKLSRTLSLFPLFKQLLLEWDFVFVFISVFNVKKYSYLVSHS